MSAGKGLIKFKKDEQLASLEQFIFVRGILEVLPNPSLYILIVSSANSKIHTPKILAIGQPNNFLSTMVSPYVSCQESVLDSQPNPNAVNTVSINLSQGPLKETRPCGTLYKDYWNNIKIPEAYDEYRRIFL